MYNNGIAMDNHQPEKVLHVNDPGTGMKGLLAIDTSVQGMSAGGVRMLPDITAEEICALSRAMTHKFAVFGIPMGGAKSGIWLEPGMENESRKEVLRAFGKAIRSSLESGVFIGPDIGTNTEDVTLIYEGAGLPPVASGLSREMVEGEPLESLAVGYGAVVAAKVACRFCGFDMTGAKVAIEGFGKAGSGAAHYMMTEGANVVAVSTLEGAIYDENGLDIPEIMAMRKECGDRLVREYQGGKQIDKRELFSLPVDILVPGARPHVIDKNNVCGIQAKVISGVANIPITDEADEILFQQGVVSVPDFISNAGGVILALISHLGGTIEDLFNELRIRIGTVTERVLSEARNEGTNPRCLAMRKNLEKIRKQRK